MSNNFQKVTEGINLTPRVGAPSSPKDGDIYYSTTLGLQFRQAGAWVSLPSGSSMSNPMTTTGDIIYSSNNSGTPARLAIGDEGSTLQVGGSGIPIWVQSLAGPGRGVFAGGYSADNTIDYIDITSASNATDFGNLVVGQMGLSGCSSIVRGLFNGCATDNLKIEYITIATAGNATNFGDVTVARGYSAAFSNRTRGVFAGGYNDLNTIDYVTIATTGNATDFGYLTLSRHYIAGCGSPTRGLSAGGYDPFSINVIDYVTIMSAGNATDFGDLTQSRAGLAGASSNTRGVFAGGDVPAGEGGGYSNVIDYVTIASTGNATDFGDLTVAAKSFLAGTSTNIRAVIAGGYDGGNFLNTIDYVTIASTGNATDFGDLTVARELLGACSDSHGGLQ